LISAQRVNNKPLFTDMTPYSLARFAKGQAIREPQMM